MVSVIGGWIICVRASVCACVCACVIEGDSMREREREIYAMYV